jgi:16S rRNA (cytidine1402-2'-O)-methyltransferase
MEKIIKRGGLFVVSTPVGNLKDITLRALDTLRQVDLIACEDTRITKRLLSAYGISKALISYREQNRDQAGRKVIEALTEGRDAALVTDAGTPGISDPGGHLIALCIDEGIDVIPIPGPSSIITALVVSGLAIDRFVFFGFLPRGGKKREVALAALASETKTSVIFESPARVVQTLRQLHDRVGDRRAVLCREMTKIHEEVIRGPILEIIEAVEKKDRLRGEVVIVLAGGDQQNRAADSDAVKSEVLKAMARHPGARAKELAGLVSDRLGVPSSVVYSQIIKIRK